MKTLKFFLIVFLMFNIMIPVYAQTSTDEVVIKKLNELTAIGINKTGESYGIAVDDAIEIFKLKPSALESYYALYWLTSISRNETLLKKYNELKDKFYSSIENFDSNQAEKLVIIALMGSGIDATNIDDIKDTSKASFEMLKKIKNACVDKNYNSLITLFQMFDDENYALYVQEFKAENPNHTLIPIFDLTMVGALLEKKEPQNCIESSLKLIEKYKNVSTPYGWKVTMDYYNLIVLSYAEMKDYNNAKKYYELMKKEAPSCYHIDGLKRMIDLKIEIDQSGK